MGRSFGRSTQGNKGIKKLSLVPQRPQEKNNGNQGKNETKFRRICGGHTPIRVISLSKS